MPLSVGTKVRAPFILNKNSERREKCKNNNNKKASLYLFVHLSTFLCESLRYQPWKKCHFFINEIFTCSDKSL